MICRPLMGRPPLLGRMFPSLWAANCAVAVGAASAEAACHSSASTSAARDGAREFAPRGDGADAVTASPSRSGGVAALAGVAKPRRPTSIKRAVELS